MKTFCINLKTRKDRRKKMIKQFSKYKMESIEFFTAKLHPNGGITGCRDSHLQIIKKAKQQNLPFVMILEDDLLFSQNLHNLPVFPEHWKMLYLGGTITSNIPNTNENWVCIKDCWTTCGYILHSDLYDKVISDLENYQNEVDRYYVEEIQYQYPCYLVNPVMIKQRNDYSDIEKRNVNYDTDNILRNPYQQVSHEIKDNQYILKSDDIEDKDLPNVSIITPTRNRKNLFVLALNNFYNISYPMKKLEWIIIDDSCKEQKVKDMLPDDERIKYINLQTIDDEPLPISKKRNIGVENSTNNIIIHMDDDDFYYPDHVLSRVKALLSNKEIQCVGSTQLGCYNVLNQQSFKIGDESSVLAEASMCYYKKFWLERSFFERVKMGEAIHFLKGREKYVAQIPFTYIMIALTHDTNITKKLRSTEENINVCMDQNINLFNEFDSFTKTLLQKLYT